MRKLFSVLMALSMILTLVTPAMAETLPKSNDTVILYSNDIHTYIDNNAGEENADGLTYSKVAALKASYDNALLVDAGDHIQGTAYGQMDSGKTVIKLMNAAGYDLATLGNHEFDYDMDGCMQAIEWAQFPYVSCNFYHEKNGVPGENVLDSYKIFDVNGTKIAFVGITTPETITSSAPSYFQDDDGNYIYGIAAGADGSELYAAVQTAIDDATEDGADYVIALGHLGVDPSSEPWTSRNVIANTAGLDAFIDGHSHTTMEMETVTDKDGDTVVLTQTGSYLNAVGKLTISADGTVTTELLYGDDLAELTPDADVKAIEDAWVGEVNDKLGEVIGYAEITLDNFDADGNRLVRKQSTNTGDFSADALYYLFDEMGMDVDVAVMNGGGIRNNAVSGELSYLTCKEIHPFGNVACLLTVTGQQLLDALEWGSKDLKADGLAESGSLLHVSGLKYTLDLSYDSTVQSDDKDVWTGPPTGEYRVKNVEVRNNKTGVYEPLDLDAEYNLAGYNYTLRDLGGGFAMLNGAVNVLDYVAEDHMVLANYIKSFPVNGQTGLPTITAGSGYDDVTGSGRITIVTDVQEIGEIYVGGTQVTGDNANDVFGDGKVSYDPSSKTLTLNNYIYQGEGYLYESGVNEDEEEYSYTAAIYSEDSITIDLVGASALANIYDGSGDKKYGDGIVVEGGITFTGTGNLTLAGSYGIYADKDVIIDCCDVLITSTDDGILSYDGSVTTQDGADVLITAGADGIYAWNDVSVTDSTLKIQAEEDGIYTYWGSVAIDCTEVTANPYAPGLLGTCVTINAGWSAIFAYEDLAVSGMLTITTPEGGRIVQRQDTYDEDEDGIEDLYTYETIADREGTIAKDVVIEPLSYTFELKDFNMGGSVPAGQSLNQAFGEDFSEIFDTIKDGYTFVGWFTQDGSSFDFDTPINADVTICARWMKNSSGGSSGPATYKPTVEATEGGDVTVSPKSPEKGDTVTITATPDAGYEVAEITIIDNKGNEVDVTDNGNGTYAFKQPAGKVTIDVEFVPERCLSDDYADLDPEAWYAEAVDYVLQQGLMNGVGEGLFAPGLEMSRSMLVTILWSLEGKPVVNYAMSFTDVPADSWCTEAVRWAASMGIVGGYGDGTFGADDSLTREQLATILYSYECSKGGGFTGAWMFRLDYGDVGQISEWAFEPMCWMTMHDVISGKSGGILDPKGSATRAEGAQMLMRYLLSQDR